MRDLSSAFCSGPPTGQVFASFLKQSCTVSLCWCMVFSATAWFRLTFFCGLLPMSHAGLFLMEKDWRALQQSALKDQQYLKANPSVNIRSPDLQQAWRPVSSHFRSDIYMGQKNENK